MSHRSSGDVLVLQTVRVLGYADTARIAARLAATSGAGVGEAEARDELLDAQARGWVAFSSFGGDDGWSLTEAGKVHGERLVAAELDSTGARAVVTEVHRDFLPFNDVVSAACTGWQLAEIGIGEQTATLAETIGVLHGPAAGLAGIEDRLTAHLERFSGYHGRFADALTRARDDSGWITGTDRDSCHRVWFELHEDLIATLGLTR